MLAYCTELGLARQAGRAPVKAGRRARGGRQAAVRKRGQLGPGPSGGLPAGAPAAPVAQPARRDPKFAAGRVEGDQDCLSGHQHTPRSRSSSAADASGDACHSAGKAPRPGAGPSCRPLTHLRPSPLTHASGHLSSSAKTSPVTLLRHSYRSGPRPSAARIWAITLGPCPES